MKKTPPKANQSRRNFLTAIGATGAAFLCSPLVSWVIQENLDLRVAGIVARTIGVDTHNHIDVPLTATELPGPDINLTHEMTASGLSAICMTFALDYQRLTEPGQAWERFQNGLTAMDEQLKKNGLKRALNLKDLENAHNKHQPTVIQSVEGGHFLEGKLERLQEAYSRGLRHLTLLHDSDASVPLGDVYTNAPKFGGLTAFGADVIKECNRLGVLIDLAHANTATTAAALKTTTHPVMISHTGLDTQLGSDPHMAQMMKPRLIGKEQAKMIADAGGIIGVWMHLADSPLEYARNIRALVDVIGIDHVCLGTDTKLTPAYRAGGFGLKPSNNPGEPGKQTATSTDGKRNGDTQSGQNKGRVGERTNNAWAGQQEGFYYVVVDAMLQTGFTEKEIAKIGGENFCRVFNAVTKGR